MILWFKEQFLVSKPLLNPNSAVKFHRDEIRLYIVLFYASRLSAHAHLSASLTVKMAAMSLWYQYFGQSRCHPSASPCIMTPS